MDNTQNSVRPKAGQNTAGKPALQFAKEQFFCRCTRG